MCDIIVPNILHVVYKPVFFGGGFALQGAQLMKMINES